MGVKKVVKEQSVSSENDLADLTPEKNSPEEWFKIACYLTSRGKQKEAELAIKNSLNIKEEYPIAWAILSAILLSQGRETDAEQAGKKAIAQCPGLKMTWTKMRTIIMSNAILKGANWKDPRRVIIEAIANSEWENLLSILSKASKQDLDEITTFVGVPDKKVDDIIKPLQYDTSEESRTSTRKEETKKMMPLLYDTSGERKTPTSKIRTEQLEPKSYDRTEERKITASKRKTEKLEPLSYDRTGKAEISDKFPDPESASVWFTASEAHLKRGDLVEAEKALLRGLEIDPDNGDAWLRVSSLLIGKQKYDEAIDALLSATRKKPSSSAAWYQMAYCLQKLNKWKEAIEPIRNAIRIEQNNPDYWTSLGVSEFHLGLYQDSAKSLLRAVRISPNHKDALFYLAMCMERRGNQKHALSLFIKLLNLGGLTPKMLERMAGAFERLNRPSEARESRRRAAVARKAGIR